MIKFTWKFFVLFILLSLFFLLFYIKNLSEMVAPITPNGMVEFIRMVAYLAGIVFGVRAFLTFKDHKKIKGRFL